MANTTVEEAATAPSVASPRADDRFYGPSRGYAPRRSTGTEDSQGQGGGDSRRQKELPPGARPAPRFELSRPQRSDRIVRHFAGDGLPTLALPSLARSAGEAGDGAPS